MDQLLLLLVACMELQLHGQLVILASPAACSLVVPGFALCSGWLWQEEGTQQPVISQLLMQSQQVGCSYMQGLQCTAQYKGWLSKATLTAVGTQRG